MSGDRWPLDAIFSVMPEVQRAAFEQAMGLGTGFMGAGLLGTTKYALPGKLFHGSPEKDLKALSLDKYAATSPGAYGKGAYLSESQGYANGYANGAYGRPVGATYEVSHGLQNPYFWPTKDAVKAGLSGDAGLLSGASGAEGITAALQGAGHDGVVVLRKLPKKGLLAHEVVVFDPSTTAITGGF